MLFYSLLFSSQRSLVSELFFSLLPYRKASISPTTSTRCTKQNRRQLPTNHVAHLYLRTAPTRPCAASHTFYTTSQSIVNTFLSLHPLPLTKKHALENRLAPESRIARNLTSSYATRGRLTFLHLVRVYILYKSLNHFKTVFNYTSTPNLLANSRAFALTSSSSKARIFRSRMTISPSMTLWRTSLPLAA